MQTIQTLRDEIARIQAELKSISRHRRSNNPRSKNYVVNYSELVKVHNGHVHPSILAMYDVEV